MENDHFEQLKQLVGLDSIVGLLQEAGKKAGEAKDWEQVNKISSFIEVIQQNAAKEALQKFQSHHQD